VKETAMTTEKSIIKRCTKCGENKPDTEFGKVSVARGGGLDSRCKACARAATAAWRAANPERAKVANAAWRAAYPNMVKAKDAAYRAANYDKVKAATAAYRAANPEAVRISTQNRRARKLESGGKLSPGLSDKLFKLQRGKCACCGKPLGNDYHLDHIMPLALGGSNTDDNIQLLRSTCNQQKHSKHPVDFMRQRGFLL
jgi:5-methylcytosine-specific restriction endonuclease McrA